MIEFKKIELELSETRQKLNTALGVENPTEEQRNEIASLQTKFTETEKRYQEYLRGEISAEEQRAVNNNPEAREYEKLEAGSRLTRFIEAKIREQPIDGAEAEFSKLLGIPAGQVPIECLAPRETRTKSEKVEKRQDVVTSIAGDASVPLQGHPILGRIFAMSDIEYLALTQVMAGVGEQTFPVLTGGDSPIYRAPGAEKNAVAATFSFTEVNPLAYTGRYVFRREDVARLNGYEESLRRDMSNAMADVMSRQVLTGTNNPTGFRFWTGDGNTRIGADAANAFDSLTITQFLNAVHSFPDGRVVGEYSQVRVLMSQPFNQKISSTLDSSDRPHFMDELLRQHGGYKVSGHMIDVTDGGKKWRTFALIAAGSQWTPGSAVHVMWPSIELIYDPYTGAAKREVALTMSSLWNFKILRRDPWKGFYARFE